MNALEDKVLSLTPSSTHLSAHRLFEINDILKSRLDMETYALVVEANMISMEIVIASLEEK